LTLAEIEKATLRLVAIRASRNMSDAAARLGMASVSLVEVDRSPQAAGVRRSRVVVTRPFLDRRDSRSISGRHWLSSPRRSYE
jgi:hypothetical protein